MQTKYQHQLDHQAHAGSVSATCHVGVFASGISLKRTSIFTNFTMSFQNLSVMHSLTLFVTIFYLLLRKTQIAYTLSGCKNVSKLVSDPNMIIDFTRMLCLPQLCPWHLHSGCSVRSWAARLGTGTSCYGCGRAYPTSHASTGLVANSNVS